ncbi:hypothetical protein L596_008901 [Steinernema carpocapsae]|uniref:Uncharacterized protein n=1 Tax=Steinernema carpocapsae TaxID=34508 RepID=A0A4U5PDT9_STECR|nr:hypothetical protein L596_008901 [Steinernema carpocapsae]
MSHAEEKSDKEDGFPDHSFPHPITNASANTKAAFQTQNLHSATAHFFLFLALFFFIQADNHFSYMDADFNNMFRSCRYLF